MQSGSRKVIDMLSRTKTSKKAAKGKNSGKHFEFKRSKPKNIEVM